MREIKNLMDKNKIRIDQINDDIMIIYSNQELASETTIEIVSDLNVKKKELISDLEILDKKLKIQENRLRSNINITISVFTAISATGMLVDLITKYTSVRREDFKIGIMIVVVLYIFVIMAIYDKVRLDKELDTLRGE